MKILSILLLAGLAAAAGGKKPPPANPPPANPPPTNPPPPNPPPVEPSSKKVTSIIVSTTSARTTSSSTASSSTASSSTASSSTTSSSTTSSSTATGTTYLVYPAKSVKPPQETIIRQGLAKLVKNPKTDIKESVTKKLGVNYFELKMTKEQAVAIKNDPKLKNLVRSVDPRDCVGKCFNPMAAVMRQSNAEDSVVFWNQKADTNIQDYQRNYFFQEEAGKDVTVYMIDTGAELNHVEFTEGSNVAARARWLFPDPNANVPGDVQGSWHGTGMLSRITGRSLGSAKKINPIIVRVHNIMSGPPAYLDAIVAVVADVTTKQATKPNFRPVLSMSWYWPNTANGVTDAWIDAVYDNLRELEGLGVTIVTAAGNNMRDSIDGWPARFGSTAVADRARHIPSIIVVGALNPTTGNMWWGTSRGLPSNSGSNYDNARGLPHVLAPGEQVSVATGGFPPPVRTILTDGTSPATAGVAGLAAYFLSLSNPPRTPLDVKRWITDPGLNMAWVNPAQSVLDGGNVRPWNGVDGLALLQDRTTLIWQKRSRIEAKL